MTTFFGYTVRTYTEIDSLMSSSQSMIQYTKLKSEDSLTNRKSLESELKNWPQDGKIEFKDVEMKYRDTLEPSLRDFSFKV